MNSTTEHEAFLRSEDNGRTRPGRKPQILRLGVALALTVATVAPAQTYTVLKSFTGSDGGHPLGDMVLAGCTLYGTTASGGSSSNGAVFKVNTDGSGYAVLKSFTGSGGWMLYSGLVLGGSNLYGTTVRGGDWDYGVVFKVNTDGSGYAVLKNFTLSDGACPWAGLVLSGSTLYGTAGGGSSNDGVVFKVNTDGSGYAVLKNFTGSDGMDPRAGLVLGSSTLYGTTYEGGSSGDGVVFKVNTDGSGFDVLKSFTGSDGAWPEAGLVLSGSTLYGTTVGGGSWNNGVVFKMKTDGSGYAVLKNFTGSDGMQPWGGLLLANGTLYGTTECGGSSYNSTNSGGGVVFKVNIDGSGYVVLHNLAVDGDGGWPVAGLVLAGNTLYGTTGVGGSSYVPPSRPDNPFGFVGYGVVFSLSGLPITPPFITTPPMSQTAEVGSTVGFRVVAEPPVPELAYQWFFGGTHAVVSATNAFLQLTNVQPAQAGTYTIVVTNLAGSVASAPALLSVIPPFDRRFVPALRLAGLPGSVLHLEYADSLAAPQWTSLADVTLVGGAKLCFDSSRPLPAQRFYRAWRTNLPHPLLGATMATEIPLAGAIGSSVRVDYINAIGPTDAWVTLSTVLLTNTTQFYYDLTAFGQPTRLYRLVPMP